CRWRCGGREVGVGIKAASLELGRARRRVEADFLTEKSAKLVRATKRVGLATGSVQREHELAPETLAQSRLDHQTFELTDDLAVIAERQARVDELLDRDEAQLFEANG